VDCGFAAAEATSMQGADRKTAPFWGAQTNKKP